MALSGLIYILIYFIVLMLILWLICWAIETFMGVAIPHQIKVAVAIILLLLFLLYVLGHVGVLGGMRW